MILGLFHILYHELLWRFSVCLFGQKWLPFRMQTIYSVAFLKLFLEFPGFKVDLSPHGQPCCWPSLPTGNRPACRTSHGQPACLPFFPRLVVALTVNPTTDDPPSMANHPFSVLYISVFRHLLRSRSPRSSFLTFLLLLAKWSEKLQESLSREPPPTSAEKFITPDSRRIYDEVREPLKVVHGRIVQ